MHLDEGCEGSVDLPFGARLQNSELHPFSRAASRKSWARGSVVGLFGFTSRTITLAWGTNSHSSSSRLGVSWLTMLPKPVTLPPGRARLATRPNPMGSLTKANTIGIVEVAF